MTIAEPQPVSVAEPELTAAETGPITCDVVIGARPISLGHGTRQPGETIGKVTLVDGEPDTILDGCPDEIKNALANRTSIKLTK